MLKLKITKAGVLFSIAAHLVTIPALVYFIAGGPGRGRPAGKAENELSIQDLMSGIPGECGQFMDVRNLVPVDCRRFQSGRNMIAIAFGQSNSANYGQNRRSAREAVYSFYNGGCYKAEDPMPGATGIGGSVWTRLGDKLVERKMFDSVLFASIGVGGSGIARWKTDGDLHNRVLYAIENLKKAGLTPTHFLWHQGEADADLGTPGEEYKKMFNDMLHGIRYYGRADAPIYVSAATLCGTEEIGPVHQAQVELANPAAGIFPGPDTDVLGLSYRWDTCHFTDEGMDRFAEMWVEKLRERN